MRTARMIVTLGMSGVFVSTAVPAVGQGAAGAASRPVVSRPWPPARLADGQPDVQGVWAAMAGGSVSLSNPISGGADLQRRVTGVDIRLPSRVIDPPDGQVPYQPWAAARQKQQEAVYDTPTKPEHIDTQHRCLLGGIPRLYTNVPTFRIIQSPGAVVFIWDEYHAYRVIPLDGRPHTVFTRPWTMRVVEKRRPDDEPWESACWEGNKPPDTWLLKTDVEQK